MTINVILEHSYNLIIGVFYQRSVEDALRMCLVEEHMESRRSILIFRNGAVPNAGVWLRSEVILFFVWLVGKESG